MTRGEARQFVVGPIEGEGEHQTLGRMKGRKLARVMKVFRV
jgi:hypothetical protein